jgi:SAM-dependent methyltransferase
MSAPSCRFCAAPLTHTFVELGETPLANALLREADLKRPEPRYPLTVRVCAECLLVQADQVVAPDVLFSDYAYFSSYAATWVEHAKRFAEMARARFALGPDSLVIEVASNDGYLLRHFAEAGVPVLGIDPAANVAVVAEKAGVPTRVDFFGKVLAETLAGEGRRADLLVGNNVLAHVPDLNDFVAGLATVLAPDGVLSVEFPHLLRLIEEVQFDTIYHEHFCYFSLLAVERVFAAHGLRVFDVERLPTHGGSLRVLACRAGSTAHDTGPGLAEVRAAEAAAGLDKLATYTGFAERVAAVKRALRAFLDDARAAGKHVVAYGAAAKGNTLLNVCGVGRADIDYVVDMSPHKQGRFLPGSHLPIHAPERMFETRPDYVLILPWNLREEITRSMAGVRDWGGRFVVPVPRAEVLP